jgi:hypothetical protein
MLKRAEDVIYGNIQRKLTHYTTLGNGIQDNP